MGRCLDHPFDNFSRIPDMLLRCVFDIITMGPLEIAQMRVESLQKLNVLRKKLEGTEEKLHANLPEHLRPILKGKQLTLFEKMATDVK